MRCAAKAGCLPDADPNLGPLPMEAPMAQRRHPPPLEVRESFETTRFSPQCLIDAYARLVPIRRKTVAPEPGTTVAKPTAAVTRRGGEHG